MRSIPLSRAALRVAALLSVVFAAIADAQADSLHLRGPNATVFPKGRFVEVGRYRITGTKIVRAVRSRVIGAPGVAADSGTRIVTHCEYPPDTLFEHYEHSNYYVRMLEQDHVACVAIWGYGHLTGNRPAEGLLVDSLKRRNP